MTTGKERSDALVKAGQNQQHWYTVSLDNSLMPQPKNLAEMYFICEFFAVNGMAPKGLDTPKKMMAAWIYGKQLGFGFWASLRNVAVINNRASVYGPAVLGLVRKSGKLESIKEWKEGTGEVMVAYCKVKRKGDETEYIGEFGMEDAQKAGLLDKDTTWRKYPKDMLKYKARARALYDAFSDVLENVTMYEEAVDYEEAEVVQESAFDDMPPPEQEVEVVVEPDETPGQDLSEPEEGKVVDADFEPEDSPVDVDKMVADAKPEPEKEEEPEPPKVPVKKPAKEPEPPKEEPEAPYLGEPSSFDELLDAEEPDELHRAAVGFVLQEVSEFHKISINEVKTSAAAQWKNFWGNVLGYVSKNRADLKAHLEDQEAIAEATAKGEAAAKNWWENRDYWIHSRGNGFKILVTKNLDALLEMPAEFITTEIISKWNRITEDLGPFPLISIIQDNRIVGYERRPEPDEDQF